jgi:L-alanine-DL-glutamate epimerase-like enolase superfamily enzyme
MKITDVRADFLTTGRTLLRIFTDEGVTGLAEAGWGHDRIFVAWLEDVIRPHLGQDPRQPGRHWDRLVFGIPEGTPQDWMRVPVDAVGAVDVALWDLTGKAADCLSTELLGGAARTTIPLYWSVGNGAGKTGDQMLADVRRGFDLGFRAFKIRMDWGSFRQDADPEKDYQMFRLCRESLPADVPLELTPTAAIRSTAISQGRRFEDLGIAHFEAIRITTCPACARSSMPSTCPCRAGSSSRPAGGSSTDRTRQPRHRPARHPGRRRISELRRVADLASAYNKPVMPHSPYMGLTGQPRCTCMQRSRTGSGPRILDRGNRAHGASPSFRGGRSCPSMARSRCPTDRVSA